jgi:hypothetical protein
MKTELIYVELKSGYSDNGPAWIGYSSYSKSGATIYFNGLAFKSSKGQGIGANYYETTTGNEYWISGVKKNRQDRHWAGSGMILIDKPAIDKYLEIVGLKSLPKNIIPTELEPSKPSPVHHTKENESSTVEKQFVLGRRPIAKTMARFWRMRHNQEDAPDHEPVR